MLQATGEALEGARVELAPAPDNFRRLQRIASPSPGPEPVHGAVTDAAGRYALEVPAPGLWQVRIEAEGHVPMESYPTPVVEPVTLAPVILVADRGVELEVRTRAGEPAADAWVHVRASDPDAWTGPGEGWSPAPRTGRAGADGRLRLARATDEGLEVTAVAPGGERATAPEVRAAAKLVLPEAHRRRRTVVVVDESGDAVAGVRIAAGIPAWPLGLTDAGGRAVVAEPPGGPLDVQLFTADGRRWQARLPGPDAGPPDEPVRIVFPRGREIAGRVVEKAGGLPLARALVWPRHDPGTFVLTDAEGGYELPLPPYERFSVFGLAPGFSGRSVRAQGGLGADARAPTLALERALEIPGKVVDAAGRPLAAVSVALVRADGATLSWALSDARGGFRLAGPGPGSRHRAVARKHGYSTLAVPVPGAGYAEPLRLVLHRSRGGFGRVVDGDERPISGAEVRLSAFGAPPAGRQEPVTVRTDGQGRFTVAALPGPRIDLEARAPGYAPLRIRGVEVPPPGQPDAGSEPSSERAGGPADLGTLVLIAGTEIAGRVTDPGGEPVAEAEIRVRDAEEARSAPPGRAFLRIPAGAVSDARGVFRVPDLQPGQRLLVEVRHPRHLSALLRDVSPPLEHPLNVVLEPAASLRGQVLSNEGEPVAGARVAVGAAPPEIGVVAPRKSEQKTSHSTVADEEGRFFVAGVAPGDLEVFADAEGFQPSPPVRLELRPREAVEGLRLVLARGAVVEGYVTGEEGEPVAEAAVRLASQRGVSDVEGRFRLTGVRTGPETLRVEHPGYERWQREVLVEAGENLLEIVLERGLGVAGRVVDDGGEPVAGARVVVEKRDWRDPRQREATSGEDGRFEVFGVADGAYDLEASAAGYATTRLEAAFRIAGESVDGLEVVLRPGSSIFGKILGLEFDQLLGVEVTAESGPTLRRGTVDYEGGYRLADLAPGNWRVRASLEGGRREASRHVAIREAAQQVERDLEFDGVVLSGVVTYDGRPLPETKVELTGRGVAERRAVVTDYQGGFELRDLEPASYRLSVSNAQELLNHTREVQVLSSREIRVDLESAAVRGRVVAKGSSRPVDNALVIFSQLLGGGEIGSMVSLVADAEGAFRVARLTPGRYRLEARKDAYAPAERLLEIRAGTDVEDLEIALEATEGVEILARLASGRLPGSLLLIVLDDGGRQVFSELRVGIEGGYVHFPTVPPGSWELVISTPGGATRRLPATVPGPPIEAVLQDAGRLRVQVRGLAESNLLATLTLFGPQGRPFETVDGAGRLKREWTVTGGAAVVDDVPAGSWVLRVVAADGQTWEGTVTTTGAPSAQVEL